MKNHQFRLKQRPTGRAKFTDFDFVEIADADPMGG
jgi:hypothetical protein